MKKYLLIMLVVMVGLSLTGFVSAADVDKDAIKAKVDEIAVAIEGGKPASDFADAANLKPHYVYIMEESGNMLVHPSLVGKSLKEAAMPAFEAVSQATMEGGWVKYEWKGAEKNAYVRKTKTGVIVGSGY
jgi:hypothetical protein